MFTEDIRTIRLYGWVGGLDWGIETGKCAYVYRGMASERVMRPFYELMATRLGVVVTLSEDPRRKLDVYDRGVLVARIGKIDRIDWPMAVERYGLRKARKIRLKYKESRAHLSHVKSVDGKFVRNTNYWTDKILWG